MLPESLEDELWVRYRRDNDVRARECLFLQYTPLATTIARNIQRRLWTLSHADGEDFVQNAQIGLLDALSRFDPGRGVAFPSFAKSRIRGAVFNGLRAIIGTRGPSDDDLRHDARLETLDDGKSGDPFDSLVDSIVGLGIGYMLDEEARRHDPLAGCEALAYTHRSETQARLAIAVDSLPERLRVIIRSHYFEFVPLNEMAAAAGITKGRMSQLHKSALQRLRALLRESSD